jgi:hypothetical protein
MRAGQPGVTTADDDNVDFILLQSPDLVRRRGIIPLQGLFTKILCENGATHGLLSSTPDSDPDRLRRLSWRIIKQPKSEKRRAVPRAPNGC